MSRFYAVCDCETVKYLGEFEDIFEAFDAEPDNTNFVTDEAGLVALQNNITEALAAGKAST